MFNFHDIATSLMSSQACCFIAYFAEKLQFSVCFILITLQYHKTTYKFNLLAIVQFCHHEQILYLCLAYISECFACVQSNILVTSCRNALYYSCEEFCWHCCMCTPCCVCKHLQSDVMWSLLWHLFSYQLLGLGIWHVNGFLIHLCVVYSFFGYFFLFFFFFFHPCCYKPIVLQMQFQQFQQVLFIFVYQSLMRFCSVGSEFPQ